MPCFVAVCLTGEAASSRPRPLGLSGWVTTNPTWCPLPIKPSRVGTANFGVPAKTSVSGWFMRTKGSLPLASLYQLLNFALDQISLQGAEMADVQLAIQMICFMQKRARQELFPGLFVEFAV